MNTKNKLSAEQKSTLIQTLKNRFEKNMNRHKGLEWNKIESKLEENSNKLWSISEMERTGGEPDLISYDKKTNEYLYADCAIESPKERRSVCYDKEGLESRKEFKPENNAIDMAIAMCVEILTETQYRMLQELGDFDTKTSSWIHTPDAIRKLGGAIFGDKRYGHVFVYHNGAQSYYGSRGFRTCIKI